LSEPELPPALLFHPDAYDFAPSRLMGRQSAGHGFLRAVVNGRGGEAVAGFGPAHNRADFEEMVRRLDASAPTAWVSSDVSPAKELERLNVVHRADPVLAADARFRLRFGPAAYCMTGVTHTLSSSGTMEAVGALLAAPLQDWDAVICTSKAAHGVVSEILQAETDYLRWKFGPSATISSPRLPVIPLGIHSGDFDITDYERIEARRRFAFDDDELVLLYAGRFSFHSKAHPLAMFEVAQRAAELTKRKLVLACHGRAPNSDIRQAFVEGAATFSPDVRAVFLDGVDVPQREVWAGADLFISFADSLQETFGLTPVEAMAAGLPCLISDWNGYRETVRDGIDGFCVPTFMPAPGGGDIVAKAYETGTLDYKVFTWFVTTTVSVDTEVAVERLVTLIENPELRKTMGASGAARAREFFDWANVYSQYQDLWRELNARRLHGLAADAGRRNIESAPKVSSAYRDPFDVFKSYPTHAIGPSTKVAARPDVRTEDVRGLLTGPYFKGSSVGDDVVIQVWAALKEPSTVQWLSVTTDRSMAMTLRAVALLAKMGFVDLSPEKEAP
jgi:glycosyltransferase involved in cell wall biosynthesis